jgi:type I restriction enzyme S subunit
MLDSTEEKMSTAEHLFPAFDSFHGKILRLRQSVLHKAFAGELVPQDPKDEPASLLITRIQEQRSQTASEKERAKKGFGKRPEPSEGLTMPKKPPTERRPLFEVLRDAGDWITPEKLFVESRHDDDSIDDFYEELKKGVESNLILEKRPNNSEVFLKATES